MSVELQKKESNKITKKKRIIVGLIIAFAVIIVLPATAFAAYIINNTYAYQWDMDKVWRAGYKEKQVSLTDGSVLNYAEGPDNGPALMLLHGQGGGWESYSKVLPSLSKYYHIYAVDCYGHGGSSKNKAKYSANAIGKDLAWFMENMIGEKAVVSGHSSGGLLTAWLAANVPQYVSGVVLEDPPLFSCEDGRKEKAFNYNDLSTACYTFLNQTQEKDFTLWYYNNQYMWNMMPTNATNALCTIAKNYRQQHPNERLTMNILPQDWMGTFFELEDYDPAFGLAFYDGTWNQEFDHTDTLSKVKCPAVLIHSSWDYDDKGILLGAMDDKDAERANSLMANSTLVDIECLHCAHAYKPDAFKKVMVDFLNKIPK